jgi:hypothetical protein
MSNEQCRGGLRLRGHANILGRKRNRNKSRQLLKEEEKEKRGGNIKKGEEDNRSGQQRREMEEIGRETNGEKGRKKVRWSRKR